MVTHEHPYTFSHRVSTLDHLTKGRAFAVKNAEIVFINAPTLNAAKATVKKLRADYEQVGRSPEEVKILTMFTPIVGETEEEAIAKFENHQKYISHEADLALFGG